MSIFCDQTVVQFIGGKGGNGAVHFHREKFVARGGPDGGDGGQGGSIILEADINLNTLQDFNIGKIFKAGDGANGQKNNMSGKAGEDLILKVPAGTILRDDKTKELLCDLKKHGQRYVVAKGGRGGFGNEHFKSSIHKTPQFAELGEEGEVRTVLMELQLVADVGIIGFPSAGKSTLISRISNAKPKIAAYPFTTLIPNLGVVAMSRFDKRNKDSFVVADIPGLIEGAHRGKGLGHKFLRHVSRTEVLVHLIDPTRENPVDYIIINEELEAYNKNLATKEQIIVISKGDAVDEETLKKFKKELEKLNPTRPAGLPGKQRERAARANSSLKKKILILSSVTGEGLKELVFEMYKRVQEWRKRRQEMLEEDEKIIEMADEKIFRPHLEKKKFEVIFRRTKLEAATKKIRNIFDVQGDRIEQVVKMTDVQNEEGLERIYHFLKKMGIMSELKKQGAKAGDRIRIAGKTFLMR